jgi:hypothetical protein
LKKHCTVYKDLPDRENEKMEREKEERRKKNKKIFKGTKKMVTEAQRK